MELPMRLGLGQFNRVTDERLRFIKQLGVDDVVFNTPILPGLPGRDEQIGLMAATIRNMGRAGIPILGYHWMPNSASPDVTEFNSVTSLE